MAFLTYRRLALEGSALTFRGDPFKEGPEDMLV